MPFGAYISALKRGDGEGKLYLTTQYDDSDENENEAGEESPSEEESDWSKIQLEEKGKSADPPQVNARKRKRQTVTSSSEEQESHSSSEPSLSSDSSVVLDLPCSQYPRLPSSFHPPPLDPVLPRPTHALADDFDVCPHLMGNLVLQQTNLWLGDSTEGKSSGLHHDFHDNLYALVAGRKRFVLFPPVAFDYLRPRGTVERVHANGLIEYTPRGQLHVDHPMSTRLPLRSDGLPPGEAARWRLLARKSAVEAANESAAARAGEAHIPKGRRKGKAKMSAEQELLLEKFEDSVQEVFHYLEIEAEGKEEGQWGEDLDSGGERVFYPQRGNGDGEDSVTSSDEDDEVDEDSKDNGNSDVNRDEAALPLGLRQLVLRARAGDELAAHMLAQLMTEVQEENEGYVVGIQQQPQIANSDEDECEDKVDGRVNENDEKHSGSDEDSDGEHVLRIPRRAGNLPGGLRRDELEEYEDYEDVAEGDLLLIEGEDGEFLGSDDDAVEENEAGEEQLAAMAALRSEVTARLRRRGIEPNLMAYSADTPQGSDDGTANSDRDDEDEGEGVGEHLRAAMQAHLEVGGQLIVGDGSTSSSEGSRDSSAFRNSSETSGDQGSDGSLLRPAELRGMDTESSHEYGESSYLESNRESQLFDSFDEDSNLDWNSDLDDGEAALADLEAQAAGREGLLNAARIETSAEDKEPLSFSLIDPVTLHHHFGLSDQQYSGEPASSAHQGERLTRKSKTSRTSSCSSGPKPRKGCPKPLVAELKPGEMLYLPASWWHEVTSQASRSTDPQKGSDIHMALNWWYHPPDNIFGSAKRKKGKGKGGAASSASSAADSALDPFQQPYRDAEVWDEIRNHVRRELSRKSRSARRWKRGNGLLAGSVRSAKNGNIAFYDDNVSSSASSLCGNILRRPSVASASSDVEHYESEGRGVEEQRGASNTKRQRAGNCPRNDTQHEQQQLWRQQQRHQDTTERSKKRIKDEVS